MVRFAPLWWGLAGCSISHGIAPLERGEDQIAVSLGGPLLSGSTPVLPLSAVTWRRGLTDRTTFHASLYPTQLALFGVVGVGGGAFTEVVEADGARPRVTIDGQLLLFAGDVKKGDPAGAARLFEEVTALAVWDVGRHHVWTGVDTMFQLFPTPHALPSPVLGLEVKPTRRFGVQLEGKWAGFWHNTDVGFVDWRSPGHQGALVVQLGVEGRFGGSK
jgi:hypothetical protein